jgi:hypothetical protein
MSAVSAISEGGLSASAVASDAAKTCPSAPAEPGSVLFGVVVAPGDVAYLSPNVPVTQGLLDDLARNGMAVENRLRFAGKCMERHCVQWAGGDDGRCSLADRAIAALSIEEGREDLPKCGIRSTCRWYAQHRAKACAACPEVIRRPEGA